jgi:hypothetical protein
MKDPHWCDKENVFQIFRSGAIVIKLFYGLKLLIFVINLSVCSWQAFPAECIVGGQGQEPTLVEHLKGALPDEFGNYQISLNETSHRVLVKTTLYSGWKIISVTKKMFFKVSDLDTSSMTRFPTSETLFNAVIWFRRYTTRFLFRHRQPDRKN